MVFKFISYKGSHFRSLLCKPPPQVTEQGLTVQGLHLPQSCYVKIFKNHRSPMIGHFFKVLIGATFLSKLQYICLLNFGNLLT